jgi:hypothetical protein
MTKDPRATLRAALAAYILSTYGVPIEKYCAAWFNEPDGGTQYPFDALSLVDIYDCLAVEQNQT